MDDERSWYELGEDRSGRSHLADMSATEAASSLARALLQTLGGAILLVAGLFLSGAVHWTFAFLGVPGLLLALKGRRRMIVEQRERDWRDGVGAGAREQLEQPGPRDTPGPV